MNNKAKNRKVHPNNLTDNILISSSWADRDQNYEQELNLFLLSFQMCLVFYELATSSFNSPNLFKDFFGQFTNKNIWDLNYLSFSARYVNHKKPFSLLFRYIILVSCFFSIQLKVYESILDLREETCLHLWNNAIWTTYINMITSGYGNCFPITYIGRAINILTGIFGTVIFSLIVVSVSEFIKFNKEERRTYFFLENSQVQQELCESATAVVVNLTRAFLAHKRGNLQDYHWNKIRLENCILSFKRAKRRYALDSIVKSMKKLK